MKREQITTSVALFYRVEPHDPIPFAWFERATELFDEFHLSPILFTAGGGPFELDDCYRLADEDGEEFRWEDPAPIYARRASLINSLRNGEVYGLGLDAPRANGRDRSDWHADVSASATFGKFYVGLDEELIGDPVVLLRRALEIAHGLFDVRYGFSYKMPLAGDPECYAIGRPKSSLSEVLQMIRHRHEWDRREKTKDELWGDELNGQRRHLTGLLRGAYPASILSDAHVRNADLMSHQVGRLSKLDASHWLWELSDDELPVAQAMLESRRVLVSQADHDD